MDPSLVAHQIGGFLDTLHAYPIDRAGEAGVVETRDLVAHWRDRAFEGLGRIVGLDGDLRAVARYLENAGPRLSKGLRRSFTMTYGPSIFSSTLTRAE